MENNTIQHAKRKAKIYELIADYQDKIEKAKRAIQEGKRFTAKDFHSANHHSWLKFTDSDNHEEATEDGLVTMSEEFKEQLHDLVVESYVVSCREHIKILETELRSLMPQSL